MESLIGTLTKDARRAKGNDLEAVCRVAFFAAKRDGKPYNVGATYYGWKIGCFPKTQTQFRVEPTGNVFKLSYSN